MGKTLSIVVVDDEPDVARATGTLLKIEGHQVRTFNSAADALESLEHAIPDVILADLGMPEMDGCELANRIRQMPGCEVVVLVALTGFSDENHLRAAIEAGFDYRFVKPMLAPELHKLMAQIASQGR